jgi:hypothetical protein
LSARATPPFARHAGAQNTDQNPREQNDLDEFHPKNTDEQKLDFRPDQSTRVLNRR